MTTDVTRILLIEDNPDDADLLREFLSENTEALPFSIDVAERLSRGLERIAKETWDVVLLDLGLPDSQGLDTFTRVNAVAGRLPVIILSGLGDEGRALAAVQQGAQDYLVKGQVDGNLLRRSISYAIQRGRAAEALCLSEERYRMLTEQAGLGVGYYSLDGTVLYFNSKAISGLGGKKEDYIGRSLVDIFDKRQGATWLARFRSLAAGGPSAEYEDQVLMPDGLRWFNSTYSGIANSSGDVVGIQVVSLDITARKAAEEAVIRSKLLLQNVIDSTPDWMYVKDFEHKYLLVNKAFAQAQEIAPQNMIGKADTEFFSEELCLGNADNGMAGYHSSDDQAFQGQVVHNPRNIITWANGIEHLYDTYRIPLTDQAGKIYAALVYSRDITEQARAEEQREEAFESLQRSMHNVIDTMARVVEMRDPYTAGHQRRVANLAGAIAREMNLGDSIIEHLVMAATIHDIGKMYVPSDLLSKPGKLSDMEFSLMKTHPQGSFDIIKDIEFTQPVALMTLQHHERLDGSGYPNGLKGDAIMIESKILAVADVVEAMASHRPYRPALGIDRALEEISKNKCRLYDPAAVDACMKLFTEKGFRFEEQP
jgi:PAS domain S-box-containing protein